MKGLGYLINIHRIYIYVYIQISADNIVDSNKGLYIRLIGFESGQIVIDDSGIFCYNFFVNSIYQSRQILNDSTDCTCSWILIRFGILKKDNFIS